MEASMTYWAGVLTIPLVVIVCLVTWHLLRALMWAGSLIPVTLMRLARPGMTDEQRGAFAAVTYAAKRSWSLAAGDIAFVVVVGQDNELRQYARGKLRRTVSIINRRFFEDEEESDGPVE